MKWKSLDRIGLYCAYTIQRPIIMEDCRFWALVSILSFSVSPAYRVTGDRYTVRYSTRVKLRCRMVQYQGRGIEASVGTGIVHCTVQCTYRYWYHTGRIYIASARKCPYWMSHLRPRLTSRLQLDENLARKLRYPRNRRGQILDKYLCMLQLQSSNIIGETLHR